MEKQPHELLMPRADRYGRLRKERFVLRYPLWLLLIIPAVLGFIIVFVAPIFEELDGYWSPQQRKWRKENAAYEHYSDTDREIDELGLDVVPVSDW